LVNTETIKILEQLLYFGNTFSASGSGDPGSTPWSGSLRHVDEKKKKSKPVVEDDLYGDAPWMGTLRHVKQEAKVFNAIKPQFKRYPDEDAPNPYSGMQGELCQELVEKIDMQSDRSFK
jgi:hypothetical protein